MMQELVADHTPLNHRVASYLLHTTRDGKAVVPCVVASGNQGPHTLIRVTAAAWDKDSLVCNALRTVSEFIKLAQQVSGVDPIAYETKTALLILQAELSLPTYNVITCDYGDSKHKPLLHNNGPDIEDWRGLLGDTVTLYRVRSAPNKPIAHSAEAIDHA